MQIVITGWNNGSGMTQSMRLVASVLREAGHDVSIVEHETLPRAGHRWDLTVCYERVAPPWMRAARRCILIPNQEWFNDAWLKYLPAFDCVFCKTRHAQSIFRKLGCPTELVGFTSHDRRDDSVPRDSAHWLHMPGRSLTKGTDVVLKAWAANPDFPHLTVIQSPEFPTELVAPANVEYICRTFPYAELQFIMNACGVHLCPSEAEGWGHYIVEAMSAGALVISTDGPPMNEIVTEERGALVPVSHTEPLRLGLRCGVSPSDLEAAVRRVMAMPEAERAARGAAARDWYVRNDSAFRQSLPRAVQAVMDRPPAATPRRLFARYRVWKRRNGTPPRMNSETRKR